MNPAFDKLRTIRQIGPHLHQQIVKAVEGSSGSNWIIEVGRVMKENGRQWIPGRGDSLDQDVLVVVLKILRGDI